MSITNGDGHGKVQVKDLKQKTDRIRRLDISIILVEVIDKKIITSRLKGLMSLLIFINYYVLNK